MKLLDAVEKILREAGEPLNADEITKRILDAQLWSSEGKTPAASVGARIYTEIKNAGTKSIFKRLKPGLFTLNNVRDTVSSKKPKRNRSIASPKESYTFLDAAELVLNQFGDRNAMHYRDITDRALELGWINTTGQTPDATMNARLVVDIKKSKASGEPGRFIRTSPGHFSLAKWTDTGMAHEISEHNQKIRKQLLSQLMLLSPDQFEELVGQLLAEMGYISIEITSYGSDGGIDVRGTMMINDAISIKMAVQVKRWKNNIQRPTVQGVRGSLGVHEQGLIITTSDFSPGAKQEAEAPNKIPVGLMNGEQLVSSLMAYNIGVRRMSHDLFELEDFPLIENEKS